MTELTKYYYTFLDIFKLEDTGNDDDLRFNNQYLISDIYLFSAPQVVTLSPALVALINSTENMTLFNQYILPKYWNNYIAVSDDYTTMQNNLFKFFGQFIAWLLSSSEKYTPIINAFQTKKTLLLAQIAQNSDTLMKFNDTPQGSGDFSDDSHATNVTGTSSTSSSDMETPIKRLAEINDTWHNIYEDWAKEFGRKFIIYD